MRGVYSSHRTGCSIFLRLLVDRDPGLQEQAFHIVRHLAETEEYIEKIFVEFGSDNLMGYLAPALETDNSDILLQAGYLKTSGVVI